MNPAWILDLILLKPLISIKSYIRLKLTVFSIYYSFLGKYILAPTIYPFYNAGGKGGKVREGRKGVKRGKEGVLWKNNTVLNLNNHYIKRFSEV